MISVRDTIRIQETAFFSTDDESDKEGCFLVWSHQSYRFFHSDKMRGGRVGTDNTRQHDDITWSHMELTPVRRAR